MEQVTIIHLDDDILYLEKFKDALDQRAGDTNLQVLSFEQIDQLRYLFKSSMIPAVVVLDIGLSGAKITGKDLIREVKAAWPSAAIVMCSDRQDLTTVRQCLSYGADDFIFKGADDDELNLRIRCAHNLSQKIRATAATSRMAPSTIGVGRTLEGVARRVPMIIDSAVSAVHISGESGTGKEVVADMFESALPKSIPFQRLNCGAIAPSLLEGELFGHVKGAFTGATANKKGILEACDGGWIVLDEVASLSVAAQVSLLRVLENKSIRPVGSTEDKSVSIRVISSTNESIPALIESGKFRQDLWQRLCEASIKLPPLRDRLDEVDSLINYFCKKMEHGPYQISENAVSILRQYDWRRGNIRELRNCLRAMTELAADRLLTPFSIPQDFWENVSSQDVEQTGEVTILGGQFQVTLSTFTGQSFEDLTLSLLKTPIERQHEKSGKLSIRALSEAVGIPKSTLSSRLRDLVFQGHMSIDAMNLIVGVGKISGLTK